MGRPVYAIEVASGAGWHRLWRKSRHYCAGYLQAREDGPTPRCAMRMVRIDGDVVTPVRTVEAVERPRLELVAGVPSAHYRRAEEHMRALAEQAEERERRAAQPRGMGDGWRPTSSDHADLLAHLERFAPSSVDATTPAEVLAARVQGALRYIAEIEAEGRMLATLCNDVHLELDAAGAPGGTPAERVRWLLSVAAGVG